MFVSDLLQIEQSDVQKVESLEVHSYASPHWHDCHSVGLAVVCARFKVEHLRFVFGDSDNLPLLALEAKGKEYPFLPFLKSVHIQVLNENFPCESLYRHARIKLIHWNIHGMVNSTRAVIAAEGFFRKISAHDRLDHVYSVREIKVTYSEDGQEKNILGFFKHSVERQYLSKILTRNQKAWKLCQDAIVVCIALGRKRISKLPHLGRDAMGIIVGMLWATRGTKSWSREEIK